MLRLAIFVCRLSNFREIALFSQKFYLSWPADNTNNTDVHVAKYLHVLNGATIEKMAKTFFLKLKKVAHLVFASLGM